MNNDRDDDRQHTKNEENRVQATMVRVVTNSYLRTYFLYLLQSSPNSCYPNRP